MAHHHSHTDSNHGHHHAPETFNRAFLIAIIANGLFVLIQIFYAIFANSTSLLADAIHNLGDVLSLILAWIANGLLTKAPTQQSTYGLKKTSILASLANGILLVFSCGFIVSEAMYKLFSPSEISTLSVMVVASIGIVVNGTTAALFAKGSDDLNIRGAYLHLFYDAVISLGVVISAALMYWTNWLWLDPIVGLLIAIIILKGTWSLFSDSFRLIIDAVPKNISWSDVYNFLHNHPGVMQVHDLHIWALSTKENAMSVHLLMPDLVLTDAVRQSLTNELKVKHNIHHTTIQVEQSLDFCDDACARPLCKL